MELKLNVYKNKEIEKTYTADTYDLMFGTVEDFVEVIDLDKLSSGKNEDFVSAVGKLVAQGLGQLKPLILDVFDGITEEELRRCKTKDITKVIMQIIKYSVSEMSGVGTGKNA